MKLCQYLYRFLPRIVQSQSKYRRRKSSEFVTYFKSHAVIIQSYVNFIGLNDRPYLTTYTSEPYVFVMVVMLEHGVLYL